MFRCLIYFTLLCSCLGVKTQSNAQVMQAMTTQCDVISSTLGAPAWMAEFFRYVPQRASALVIFTDSSQLNVNRFVLSQSALCKMDLYYNVQSWNKIYLDLSTIATENCFQEGEAFELSLVDKDCHVTYPFEIVIDTSIPRALEVVVEPSSNVKVDYLYDLEFLIMIPFLFIPGFGEAADAALVGADVAVEAAIDTGEAAAEAGAAAGSEAGAAAAAGSEAGAAAEAGAGASGLDAALDTGDDALDEISSKIGSDGGGDDVGFNIKDSDLESQPDDPTAENVADDTNAVDGEDPDPDALERLKKKPTMKEVFMKIKNFLDKSATSDEEDADAVKTLEEDATKDSDAAEKLEKDEEDAKSTLAEKGGKPTGIKLKKPPTLKESLTKLLKVATVKIGAALGAGVLVPGGNELATAIVESLVERAIVKDGFLDAIKEVSDSVVDTVVEDKDVFETTSERVAREVAKYNKIDDDESSLADKIKKRMQVLWEKQTPVKKIADHTYFVDTTKDISRTFEEDKLKGVGKNYARQRSPSKTEGTQKRAHTRGTERPSKHKRNNEATHRPTHKPTHRPTHAPTHEPTHAPTKAPTKAPTHAPTIRPTVNSSYDQDKVIDIHGVDFVDGYYYYDEDSSTQDLWKTSGSSQTSDKQKASFSWTFYYFSVINVYSVNVQVPYYTGRGVQYTAWQSSECQFSQWVTDAPFMFEVLLGQDNMLPEYCFQAGQQFAITASEYFVPMIFVLRPENTGGIRIDLRLDSSVFSRSTLVIDSNFLDYFPNMTGYNDEGEAYTIDIPSLQQLDGFFNGKSPSLITTTEMYQTIFDLENRQYREVLGTELFSMDMTRFFDYDTSISAPVANGSHYYIDLFRNLTRDAKEVHEHMPHWFDHPEANYSAYNVSGLTIFIDTTYTSFVTNEFTNVTVENVGEFSIQYAVMLQGTEEKCAQQFLPLSSTVGENGPVVFLNFFGDTNIHPCFYGQYFYVYIQDNSVVNTMYPVQNKFMIDAFASTLNISCAMVEYVSFTPLWFVFVPGGDTPNVNSTFELVTQFNWLSLNYIELWQVTNYGNTSILPTLYTMWQSPTCNASFLGGVLHKYGDTDPVVTLSDYANYQTVGCFAPGNNFYIFTNKFLVPGAFQVLAPGRGESAIINRTSDTVQLSVIQTPFVAKKDEIEVKVENEILSRYINYSINTQLPVVDNIPNPKPALRGKVQQVLSGLQYSYKAEPINNADGSPLVVNVSMIGFEDFGNPLNGVFYLQPNVIGGDCPSTICIPVSAIFPLYNGFAINLVEATVQFPACLEQPFNLYFYSGPWSQAATSFISVRNSLRYDANAPAGYLSSIFTVNNPNYAVYILPKWEVNAWSVRNVGTAPIPPTEYRMATIVGQYQNFSSNTLNGDGVSVNPVVELSNYMCPYALGTCGCFEDGEYFFIQYGGARMVPITFVARKNGHGVHAILNFWYESEYQNQVFQNVTVE